MRIHWFIAWRYLFSRKNTHAVNIISAISMIVFLLGAAVTLIFLGFLNGLENLVKGMNSSFDPDIHIAAIHSKVFEPEMKKQILELEGVSNVTEALEENVVVRYGESQELARMKGIDTNSLLLERIDTLLLYGSSSLRAGNISFALFGNEIGVKLNVNTENYLRTADIILPRRGQVYNHLDPTGSINESSILPGGVVMISKDVDKDYVIVPIDFARELLDYNSAVTGLEVFIENQDDLNKIQKQISKIVGDDYEVKTSNQLNEAAYKVFQTEKWITFLLLMFVMIIAAFNAVGALTMLVMEKKNDIAILKSMGASQLNIRQVFIRAGMLICLLGSVLGLAIGLLFALGQHRNGWLKMENGVVDAWPINVYPRDVILVFLTVNLLGYLIALYPALKASRIEPSQIEHS